MELTDEAPSVYNKRLHNAIETRYLGVEEGLVVSPLDRSYRSVDVSHDFLMLDVTLVDLFRGVYPGVVDMFESVFVGVDDNLSEDDYGKLQVAAKIGFYLAITGRVIESEYSIDFDWLLSGQGQDLVVENFDEYVRTCNEALLVEYGEQPSSLYEAFQRASELLRDNGVVPPQSAVIETRGNDIDGSSATSVVEADDPFEAGIVRDADESVLSMDLMGWLRSNRNVLWRRLGDKFEDVVKGDFERVRERFEELVVSDVSDSFSEAMRHRFGRGVSGAIDENPLLRKHLHRGGSAVPDAFYATNEAVHTVDLKLNPVRVNPQQLAPVNFGQLVKTCDPLQVVFDDFVLNTGDESIHVSSESWSRRGNDGSYETEEFSPKPWIAKHVLDREEDLIGDVMGRIDELWEEGAEIGRDDVEGLGLSSDKRDAVVAIFNQRLRDAHDLSE